MLNKRCTEVDEVKKFRQAHQSQLPYLTAAAIDFLSAGVSSVNCERLFSRGGLIYANKLRNSLAEETVENILLLRDFFTKEHYLKSVAFVEYEDSEEVCDTDE